MPFVTLSSSVLQRIPHLEGAPSYVHFGKLQFSDVEVAYNDH